jgi:hypothetical protein
VEDNSGAYAHAQDEFRFRFPVHSKFHLIISGLINEKLQNVYKPPYAKLAERKMPERIENITVRKSAFVDISVKAKRIESNINFTKMKKVVTIRFGVGSRESGKIYEYIVYKLGDRIIIERNIYRKGYSEKCSVVDRNNREFFEVVFD